MTKSLAQEMRDATATLRFTIASELAREVRLWADRVELLTQERDALELKLRHTLWLSHGCSMGALYGDDGEMQCGSCVIDFKREPIDQIEARLLEKRRAQISGYALSSITDSCELGPGDVLKLVQHADRIEVSE